MADGVTPLRDTLSRAIDTVKGGGGRALVVTITKTGVRLRGYRTRREIFVTFAEIAAAASTPGEMPAKYVQNKLGWITESAARNSRARRR